MLFRGLADGILYIRGENGFLAAQHGADMFILDLHIMQGADPADDVIVHGNDTGFQTAAELHVGLAAAQEQNIGGVAANVDQKQAQMMLELAFLRCDGSKCLRIYKDIPNQNGHRLVIVRELDGLTAFEVGPELVLQNAVVFRGQTYRQLNFLRCGQRTGIGKLFCDSKQGENEETFIPGLIPAIWKTLAGKGPVFSLILQNFICHRRADGVPCQTGYKIVVDGLDGVIAVVDCD